MPTATALESSSGTLPRLEAATQAEARATSTNSRDARLIIIDGDEAEKAAIIRHLDDN